MQARPTIVRGLLAVLFFLAICVAMAFLVVPVVAIFTHVGPGRLLHQFSNPVVKDALVVSLKTILISQVAILVLGTPAAYFLASRRFPRSRCVRIRPCRSQRRSVSTLIPSVFAASLTL